MARAQASDDVFRAIADPTRRAILDRLRAGPANAGALAADFRQSRPAISKHLRVLRQARLVTDTRIGRERMYVVDPLPLQSVAGWIEGYRAFWHASLARLKRNLEVAPSRAAARGPSPISLKAASWPASKSRRRRSACSAHSPQRKSSTGG
jgi:DNA-binding transcriptional ArsR family regulator